MTTSILNIILVCFNWYKWSRSVHELWHFLSISSRNSFESFEEGFESFEEVDFSTKIEKMLNLLTLSDQFDSEVVKINTISMGWEVTAALNCFYAYIPVVDVAAGVVC